MACNGTLYLYLNSTSVVGFNASSEKSVTLAECGTRLHFVWNAAGSEFLRSLESWSDIVDSAAITICHYRLTYTW